MAYGLDVDAVYYTDNELTDQGVIETYNISIDLAGDKDFEIRTANYNLQIGGFWYVPDTEYGGVIRSKRTQTDAEEATYTGRSWRGILDEHFVNISDRSDVRYLQGNINDIVNALLAESDLDDLFVCNVPYTLEEIDIEIDLFAVTRGMTLYDVIWGLARHINFSYIFSYSDKVMYLTPILSEDYSDYMIYSSIGALNFDMSESSGLVNHYIITIVADNNSRRTIHLFTDGTSILPYATTEYPVKDSDYILDTSQQVLFGVDEVARYDEVTEKTTENYELVTVAPKDWKRTFGTYFRRIVDDETERFIAYEATSSVAYSALTSKPSDWEANYSNYFDRTIDQHGNYEYRAVSGNSTLDTANKKKVKDIPKDWKTDYSQYYYAYESGTGTAYATYSGVSRTKHVLLTRKPTDWQTNFGSYYRRVIEEERTVSGKKQIYYVDVKKNEKGKYKAVNQITTSVPKFRKNRYYRRETYTIAPQFLKDKTYIMPTIEVAPTFVANTYFRDKTTYTPPKFIANEVFQRVVDHYAVAVADGIEFLEKQVNTQTQKVTMGDFIVNIGDTVGGRDEYTGEEIVAVIDNINAEITNGMVEVEYIIGG